MKSPIITFDRSSLKFICKALKIPYNKNIIAITKDGIFTDKEFFDLVDYVSEKNEKSKKS